MKEVNLIVPIKESGITKHYNTDAPAFMVTDAFLRVDNVKELKEYLEEDGYYLQEKKYYVELNFDE